jgi:hypothetical protein
MTPAKMKDRTMAWKITVQATRKTAGKPQDMLLMVDGLKIATGPLNGHSAPSDMLCRRARRSPRISEQASTVRAVGTVGQWLCRGSPVESGKHTPVNPDNDAVSWLVLFLPRRYIRATTRYRGEPW